MCVNARALAKFFQCLLMKLMPLSDRNFSVLPNGKYTLYMYSCTNVFLQMSLTGIMNMWLVNMSMSVTAYLYAESASLISIVSIVRKCIGTVPISRCKFMYFPRLGDSILQILQ